MLFVISGFLVGILGGLFGVGGAEMIIPLLGYAFGFAQHKAQGTSLAMLLPPLGLLAALRYYLPAMSISPLPGCWRLDSSSVRRWARWGQPRFTRRCYGRCSVFNCC